MWPFRSAQPAVNLHEIETRMKNLELQWEDTYDKVIRTLRRLNKRDQDATSHEPARDDPRIPPGLDPRSAAIWRRRLARNGGESVPPHG